MARGGSRNRSGPMAREDSARSDARGYRLQALPAEGYDGPIPDFPLPAASERELDLWGWAWRTPQACAWSMPSQSWRLHTIAQWVRLKVRCEEPDAGAALLAQLHRFADQIGMTTAGLAEMGWKVATDDDKLTKMVVDEKPTGKPQTLREQAATTSGWQVIDGGRAG